MSEWPLISIEDICSRITSGGTPSRKEPSYFTIDGGHPWVKSAELLDNLVFSSEERISDAGLKHSSAKYLPAGTVLIAMYGANVGQLGQLAIDATVNQAVCGLTVDRQRADPRYVFFALKHHRAELIGQAKGAAQQNISATLIKRFKIPLPPLQTQRRIAAILGAYDDLIEVNQRRVAVLEEMARGLFEEWFVRFRFPGHEAVPIIDTPDGPLPQGWAYSALGDVADINAASMRPAQAPELIGYIDIASVSPGQIDTINHMPFAEAPGRARRLVRDGSILWSNVRPNRRSHALVIDPGPGVVASTGFTVLDAKTTPFTYLYHWVTTESFVGYLVGSATGAAYPAVTAATFERAKILLPHADVVSLFGQFAEPAVRHANSLREINKKLTASRDLLLPRLISGQLTLKTAERELENAA